MRASEWGEGGEFEHLMASQQRQLRRLIENRYELDEDDFVLTLGDGRWAGILSGRTEVPVIVYEPEPFFFSLTHFHPTHDGLEYIPGGHCVYFKPGEQAAEEWHYQLEWTALCRHFDDWLGHIERELGLDYGSEEDEEPLEDVEEPEPTSPTLVPNGSEREAPRRLWEGAASGLSLPEAIPPKHVPNLLPSAPTFWHQYGKPIAVGVAATVIGGLLLALLL
jgi:hypothetical protein